jgi:hypothetical protein
MASGTGPLGGDMKGGKELHIQVLVPSAPVMEKGAEA